MSSVSVVERLTVDRGALGGLHGGGGKSEKGLAHRGGQRNDVSAQKVKLYGGVAA